MASLPGDRRNSAGSGLDPSLPLPFGELAPAPGSTTADRGGRVCSPQPPSPDDDAAPKVAAAPWPLSRAELRWAAGAAGIIVALSCLPYLFGWWLNPAGFMGHVYNADDANVHLSWMRQAADGRWLFTNLFTSDQVKPHFLHLFFLVLGKIAGLLGGSYSALLLVYHAARVLCGWLLLVSVYVFAGYVYPDRVTRRLALLVAGLSSGLGWWARVLFGPGDYSRDFGTGLLMPETITFLSLYIFPLFAASMLLMVVTYLLLLRAFDSGRPALAAGAGVAGLALGQIHPYDILPVYAVAAVYVAALSVARRRPALREAGLAGVMVLLSLPGPLYQYFTFRSGAAQLRTPTPSPPPLDYALTFGLVLLAAVIGAGYLRRTTQRHGGFLVVWAAVTLAMSYAPLQYAPFQRKMIEGVHLPLAVLAAAGWVALGRQRRFPLKAWAAAFLLLTVPSNAAMMAQSAKRLLSNNAQGIRTLLPPYYLDADERAALDWLRAHAGPDDVVLSAPLVGSYMPPWCGVTVYAGHWAETVGFSDKLQELRLFWQRDAVSDGWRVGFLRAQRIRYVYDGLYEKALAAPPRFDPERAPYLRRVFGRGHVALYEVRLP